MKIGSLTLENPTIMAPLAGITDLPWRLMARAGGCALVCSEMISANGLCHGSRKTLKMLDSRPAEKPFSVQLFGSDAAIVADAARMVEDAGADLVDINFGCAVRKILKTGSGAALMKAPMRAAALLAAVRRVVRIPLTIKIRSGWDVGGAQALEIARIAEDCGVDAVCVHPRSAAQGFRGQADWSVIRRVKAALKVPVIGNGDIVLPADAVRMLRQTGCDAVMIGRAAVGNPWIFSQVLACLEGAPVEAVGLKRRIAGMQAYVSACIDYYGEMHACRMLRSRLGWFVKGLPHAAGFRESLKHLDSGKAAMQRILAYREALRRAGMED